MRVIGCGCVAVADSAEGHSEVKLKWRKPKTEIVFTAHPATATGDHSKKWQIGLSQPALSEKSQDHVPLFRFKALPGATRIYPQRLQGH